MGRRDSPQELPALHQLDLNQTHAIPDSPAQAPMLKELPLELSHAPPQQTPTSLKVTSSPSKVSALHQKKMTPTHAFPELSATVPRKKVLPMEPKPAKPSQLHHE